MSRVFARFCTNNLGTQDLSDSDSGGFCGLSEDKSCFSVAKVYVDSLVVISLLLGSP